MVGKAWSYPESGTESDSETQHSFHTTRSPFFLSYKCLDWMGTSLR